MELQGYLAEGLAAKVWMEERKCKVCAGPTNNSSHLECGALGGGDEKASQSLKVGWGQILEGLGCQDE